ncbi:MAG: hypothetical protein ABSH46_03860 [Bryobacteraceae bacterium]|jgi:hypothetical protein
MRLTFAAAAFSLVAPLAFSQSNAGAAGHWEGSISVPGHELNIVVDLARGEKDAWKGTIAIPEQNLKGFPLSSISVVNTAVKFAMNGVPGQPAFDGKLAPGGQSISGSFTQGGGTIPFSMKRTGEAQIEEVAKSTNVAKAFEGAWEGTLDTGSTQLRLVLKLANQPDGAATGTLTSVDQGGAVIPIAVITQKGSELKLEVPSVGGSFTGEISKDAATVAGTWTQGMGALPLTFHRPAAGQ